MTISYEDARQIAEDSSTPLLADQRIAPPSELPSNVQQSGSGFFDPDNTGEPPGTIHLCRVLNGDTETFRVDSRIGYIDRELGTFIVPGPDKPLTTDFASIPQIFTWIVPKSGIHLPAAILHDGFTPPRDRTYVGPEITQQQADRMFRDGMRDLGTGWIRRWLAWTAVAFATEAKSGFENGAWMTWRGNSILARLVVFVAVIALLGTMATLDLLGASQRLPWMGSPSLGYELLAGGIFAVAVPCILSLLFIRRGMTRAAIILGIAIALFLHVTALIVLLALVLSLVESTIQAFRAEGTWRSVLASGGVLGAYVIGLLVVIRIAQAIPWGGKVRFELPLVQRIAGGVTRVALWYQGVPVLVPIILLAGLGGLAFLINRKPNQETTGTPLAPQ